MRMRRLGAVVGALVAATALTACGSTSANSTGIKTVAFTPLTKADFGPSLASTAKGLRSAHMTLKSSMMDIAADVSYDRQIAMQMSGTVTAQGRTLTMSMRMIGTVMYMQIPGETPAGKYLSLDLGKLPHASAIFRAFDQYRHLGPGSMLTQFRAGVASVDYRGVAQIDGQSARHYTVVINTSAILKALGASSALPQGSMPTTVTEEVYLDGSRRPLRITMTLPDPVGPMQIDFSNWGEVVHVVAPPRSDVMPIPLGSFGTGA